MIRDHLTAGYPGLYVLTQEPHRAEELLAADACGKCEPFAWDCIRGIRKATNFKVESAIADPIGAMLWLNDMPDTVLFAHNLHNFMDSPDLRQAIANGMQIWKSRGSCLCIVAPTLNLPPEIEKMFYALDLPLPDETRLHQIQTDLSVHETTTFPVSLPATLAAKGLTEFEAETAFAFSLATKGNFDPRVVSRAKAQMIKKTGFLEFQEPEDPAMIGGLWRFRKWFEKRIPAFSPESDLPAPRAILFVGIPGTGKSLMSRILAALMQYDLIKFDITGAKNKYVGETERQTRQACQVIDAFGRSVIYIDEIDKSLGGAGTASETGDTSGSQLGILLTWMQETKSSVLLAATANKVSHLPGELLRRFTEIFFVDVPTLGERREIIQIMNRRYKAEIPLDLAPKLEGFSGADIEKLAQASRFDGIDQAFEEAVPVTKTSKETIDALRAWVPGRAKLANSEDEIATDMTEGRRLKL